MPIGATSPGRSGSIPRAGSCARSASDGMAAAGSRSACPRAPGPRRWWTSRSRRGHRPGRSATARPFVDRCRLPWRCRAGRWQRRDPGLAAGTFGALLAIDVAPGGDDLGRGVAGGRWVAAAAPPALRGRPLVARPDGSGRDRRDRAHRCACAGFGSRRRARVRASGGTEHGACLWRRDGSGWSADDQLGAIAGSMLPDGLTMDDAGRPVISGAYRGPGGGGFAAMIGGPHGRRVATRPGSGRTRGPQPPALGGMGGRVRRGRGMDRRHGRGGGGL